MLERIESSSPNVLAVMAIGEITAEDYKSVLVPAVEAAIKAHGKARFVYFIGPEFERFTPGAMRDDAVLGLKHWRDFERIAVVTDRDWIANAMRLFLPLMPVKARVFDLDHMTDALAWAAA